MALIIILMGCIGCKSSYHRVTRREKRRADNVKRVLMHENMHYTLFAKRQGSDVLDEIDLTLQLSSVKIITDVPKGKDMWAEWDEVDYQGVHRSSGAKFSENVVIHIHDAKDINGGGWSRRVVKKQVHGQTIVIE